MLNPQLLKAIVDQKLSEIVAGQVPDGFNEVERTDSKIVLVPQDGTLLGMPLNHLDFSVSFNGVEIILRYGK